jgi:hypothetical protein
MSESAPTFRKKLGRWAAELLLVFLGAYAAFSLTNYQQHRQEARRRDQILESLEQRTRETLANCKEQGGKAERDAAEFRRALAAGEMPPVRPITFSSDYNANDAATLLQSGGLELLEVKTILAMRNAESAIRGGLSRLAHIEKLSDEMIMPNLDQEIGFFYDPATKQLRHRFAPYPAALQIEADFFRDLQRAETELLQQLQAERKRQW